MSMKELIILTNHVLVANLVRRLSLWKSLVVRTQTTTMRSMFAADRKMTHSQTRSVQEAFDCHPELQNIITSTKMCYRFCYCLTVTYHKWFCILRSKFIQCSKIYSSGPLFLRPIFIMRPCIKVLAALKIQYTVLVLILRPFLKVLALLSWALEW